MHHYRNTLVAAILSSVAFSAAAQECPGSVNCIPELGSGSASVFSPPYDSLGPKEIYDFIRQSKERAAAFYAGRDISENKLMINIDTKSTPELDKLYNVGIEQMVAGEACRAAEHFQRAAIDGHRASQLALAHALFIGAGVPENNSLAHNWFTLASRDDNRTFRRTLGSLYLQKNGLLTTNTANQRSGSSATSPATGAKTTQEYATDDVTELMRRVVAC